MLGRVRRTRPDKTANDRAKFEVPGHLTAQPLNLILTSVQVHHSKTVRYGIDGQERACFIYNTETTCTCTWITLLKEKMARHLLWSK